jgi:hypothetical protein
MDASPSFQDRKLLKHFYTRSPENLKDRGGGQTISMFSFLEDSWNPHLE